MNLTIREPLPADLVRLYGLICEHAEYERSAASISLSELERLALAAQKPIRFIVAVEDGDPLGYAAVTFDWSVWRGRRYAHLNCLFVDGAHRGHGIGKRLFAKAEAIALSQGADRMEWQTPAWNEDARRFYMREGADCQAKSFFSLSLARAETMG